MVIQSRQDTNVLIELSGMPRDSRRRSEDLTLNPCRVLIVLAINYFSFTLSRSFPPLPVLAAADCRGTCLGLAFGIKCNARSIRGTETTTSNRSSTRRLFCTAPPPMACTGADPMECDARLCHLSGISSSPAAEFGAVASNSCADSPSGHRNGSVHYQPEPIPHIWLHQLVSQWSRQ